MSCLKYYKLKSCESSATFKQMKIDEILEIKSQNSSLRNSEIPLCEWFIDNYKKLGFEKITIAQSSEYMRLKCLMKFDGFPDFLVLRDGKWLKLEIECWSRQYINQHPIGYADILFCYTETEKLAELEVITYESVVGFNEPIDPSEIVLWIHRPPHKIRRIRT